MSFLTLSSVKISYIATDMIFKRLISRITQDKIRFFSPLAKSYGSLSYRCQ